MKFCKCLAILLFSTFAFLCSADELPQQWSNTILQLVFTNQVDCTNGIYTDVSFAGGRNFYQTNITNRPTWYSRYLEFDGNDDYAKCTNDPVLGLTNFTVAVWFRHTEYVASAAVISDWGISPAINWYLAPLSLTNSRIAVANGAVNDDWLASQPPYYQTGIWHHFVGEFQGSSQIVVYVDGARRSKTTVVAKIGITQDVNFALQLGRYGGTTEYKGRIGEVVIWNLLLTGAEVTNEYNRGTIFFNDIPPPKGTCISIQ